MKTDLPPIGDSARPLYLAVRGCEAIASLNGVAAICSIASFYSTFSFFGDSLCMIFAITFLIEAALSIVYFVIGYYVRTRRKGAVICGIISSSCGCLLEAFCLCLYFFAVIWDANLNGFIVLAAWVIHSVLLVMHGRLIFLLSNCFSAIRVMLNKTQRGFEPLFAVSPR